MSCNGCRVLRKGCSESCILRPCLQWIETPESQGHATVFVAKFFGRAGLMSFISAVPEHQRSALFQSLLFEACGRTVNPVNGAVGLLWTGNWHVCQSAVDTVLRGGTLRPWMEIPAGIPASPSIPDDASEATPTKKTRDVSSNTKGSSPGQELLPTRLDLCLSSNFPPFSRPVKKRPTTPSMNSEGSVTSMESVPPCDNKLLNLFV